MKVDLHIHSTASDGCRGPENLIREVQSAGVGLFAVTDHDSIGNVNKTAEFADEAGLSFIKGVEFTAKFDGKICHILGYKIDPDHPAIVNLCADNTRRMKYLNLEQMKQLIESGIDVNFDEFKEYKFDKTRGGSKVTNFLIDQGIFRNFEESLAYVAKTVKWTTPDYLSPSATVDQIKSAGGYAILAHPGSQLLGKGVGDADLEALVAAGIEGLECYTNYHSPELSQKFANFCNDRNLLITAGSDYHGPILKKRILGMPSVDVDQLNLGEIWP